MSLKCWKIIKHVVLHCTIKYRSVFCLHVKGDNSAFIAKQTNELQTGLWNTSLCFGECSFRWPHITLTEFLSWNLNPTQADEVIQTSQSRPGGGGRGSWTILTKVIFPTSWFWNYSGVLSTILWGVEKFLEHLLVGIRMKDCIYSNGLIQYKH